MVHLRPRASLAVITALMLYDSVVSAFLSIEKLECIFKNDLQTGQTLSLLELCSKSDSFKPGVVVNDIADGLGDVRVKTYISSVFQLFTHDFIEFQFTFGELETGKVTIPFEEGPLMTFEQCGTFYLIVEIRLPNGDYPVTSKSIQNIIPCSSSDIDVDLGLNYTPKENAGISISQNGEIITENVEIAIKNFGNVDLEAPNILEIPDVLVYITTPRVTKDNLFQTPPYMVEDIFKVEGSQSVFLKDDEPIGMEKGEDRIIDFSKLTIPKINCSMFNDGVAKLFVSIDPYGDMPDSNRDNNIIEDKILITCNSEMSSSNVQERCDIMGGDDSINDILIVPRYTYDDVFEFKDMTSQFIQMDKLSYEHVARKYVKMNEKINVLKMIGDGCPKKILDEGTQYGNSFINELIYILAGLEEVVTRMDTSEESLDSANSGILAMFEGALKTLEILSEPTEANTEFNQVVVQLLTNEIKEYVISNGMSSRKKRNTPFNDYSFPDPFGGDFDQDFYNYFYNEYYDYDDVPKLGGCYGAEQPQTLSMFLRNLTMKINANEHTSQYGFIPAEIMSNIKKAVSAQKDIEKVFTVNGTWSVYATEDGEFAENMKMFHMELIKNMKNMLFDESLKTAMKEFYDKNIVEILDKIKSDPNSNEEYGRYVKNFASSVMEKMDHTIDVIAKVVSVLANDESLLRVITHGKPGKEPSPTSNCRRLVAKYMENNYVMEGQSGESREEDPHYIDLSISRMNDQSKLSPTFYAIYSADGQIARGKHNPLLNVFFWEKIASCSCASPGYDDPNLYKSSVATRRRHAGRPRGQNSDTGNERNRPEGSSTSGNGNPSPRDQNRNDDSGNRNPSRRPISPEASQRPIRRGFNQRPNGGRGRGWGRPRQFENEDNMNNPFDVNSIDEDRGSGRERRPHDRQPDGDSQDEGVNRVGQEELNGGWGGLPGSSGSELENGERRHRPEGDGTQNEIPDSENNAEIQVDGGWGDASESGWEM